MQFFGDCLSKRRTNVLTEFNFAGVDRDRTILVHVDPCPDLLRQIPIESTTPRFTLLSILREHCIPGHDAVPVWDALHLIMDIWRIAEADRAG